jgi:hypothetical protein
MKASPGRRNAGSCLDRLAWACTRAANVGVRPLDALSQVPKPIEPRPAVEEAPGADAT